MNANVARLLSGFIAGFLATILVHQAVLALLWSIGLAPFAPFSLRATQPFGIPAVVSLAFWGGVWGILYAHVAQGFGAGSRFFILSVLFGALLPTLVALFVVMPLKGMPIAGGWKPALIGMALLLNACWGAGVAAFYRVALRRLAG